jgi:hypothetical protein
MTPATTVPLSISAHLKLTPNLATEWRATHRERHVGHGVNSVGASDRQPAHHHVGISHRLDLLQTEIVGRVIERRENFVERPVGPGDLLDAFMS